MSIRIDGIPISEYNLKCELKHDHPALPDTRDYTVDIPGMPGAYDYGADMGVRSFNLPFKVIETSSNIDIVETIRKLKNAILDGYGNPKEFQLRFEYDSSKYYTVRYSGSLPIERLVYRGRFVLPLTAYDPFAYSVVMNDEITWGSEIITFNADYLLGSTTSQSHKVTSNKSIIESVNGNTLRPIFNISGSADSVTITCGEQSFSLPSFRNVNWIIDGDNYIVVKGSVNGLSDFIGEFIEFSNGDNTITITGTNMNFTFEVRFRDKYM